MRHDTISEGLLRREVVLGLFLTCTSGGAILAHVFLNLPMVFTATFVVFPTSLVVIFAVLFRRRLYGRFHQFASILLIGGRAGLLATLAYDTIRPLLKLGIGFRYEPFRAIAIFGQLITGLPIDDPFAHLMGWIYHFWNGISFGAMFAFIRPRGGTILGFIWGIGLQCLMMFAYPRLLQIRLNDPGFLTSSLIGHALWGIVLGKTVQQWRTNA